MFQYRQVLMRLRAGESELSAFRVQAEQQGWLEAGAAVPDDGTIAAALGTGRRASSTVSSVEPHRVVVKR